MSRRMSEILKVGFIWSPEVGNKKSASAQGAKTLFQRNCATGCTGCESTNGIIRQDQPDVKRVLI